VADPIPGPIKALEAKPKLTMNAWLIQRFPLPPGVGTTYKFGVVVAANEAAARTAVFNELVNTHGLDSQEHTEGEVVLVPWFGPALPYGKTVLSNG